LCPMAVGVFAGAGDLEDAVKVRAQELGVASAVRMLGWRQDLPAIMSVSDWFILARPEQRMEGYGLAVVEAQLAGLHMLLSRAIADDPLLPTARYRRLALDAGAVAWAKAALELIKEPPSPRAEVFAALKASPMNMDFALSHLLSMYQ